ncbi:MAG: PAS-domain containing protein [Maritimibacter sp.]
MTESLINPLDPIEVQHAKLLKISEALMRRVEQSTDESGAAYAQFQRAALLEEEVRNRTHELERTLDLLNTSNARLADASRETEAARSNLANAIETVQEGFALFDPYEKLVMCNSRFGLHMPDIRESFVPGITFREYVDLVSSSRYLSLKEDQTASEWAAQRLTHHKDSHVIFNVRIIWSRWLQVSEHRTPDGGTVILQTDVTDIMRLERQERDRMLDDQARIIKATLEHLNQGVFIFDNQSRLMGWNQRAGGLLSIPATLFRIGTRFQTLFDRVRKNFTFSGSITKEGIQAWGAQQSGRPPMSFEMMQGGTKTLAVFAQEMPDKGFVISFTDVSAERAAVQAIKDANEFLEARVTERTLELEDALFEAERANASKSRFVAAASHDLLQPLSAAKLYLSSVGDDALEPQTREVLDKAGNALASVENILEALLDISKLDSGKAEIHTTEVPLGVLFGQLHDELEPIARQKGLELRILPTQAVVRSDATYLRRILQNLIANAVRYTDTGKVVVGLRWRDKGVRVEVWDTGPGIPEDEQEAVFGEFKRLHDPASAAEGMGLGLAIVERACGLLNHPLELQSVVGRGTVFRISLPLCSGPPQHLSAGETQNSTPASSLETLFVLLVENDADVRRALALQLERWDVTVLAASNQTEAFALLDEFDIAPDAIIADYQLDDGVLGTDVVQAVRAARGDIPACIISANRTQGVVADCAANDLTLFHKPIEPQWMREFLMNLVHQ